MAAPYNDLDGKFEEAMKLQAETVSLVNRGNALVRTGAGADDLALPRIVVESTQGEEIVVDTGNFEMTGRVMVYSDARAGLDAHRDRLAYVRDAFMQDDLPDLLSALVSDFHCLGVHERQFLETERAEDHLVGGFQFKAVCCASDLA
jgi:hypothetical protein